MSENRMNQYIVKTNLAREKMVQARAGLRTMASIEGIALGDGGISGSDEVVIPSGADNALKNEVLRRTVVDRKMISDTCCRYKITLGKTELVDKKISEMALYDTEGDLLLIMTFRPQNKNGYMEMDFEIDDQC